MGDAAFGTAVYIHCLRRTAFGTAVYIHCLRRTAFGTAVFIHCKKQAVKILSGGTAEPNSARQSAVSDIREKYMAYTDIYINLAYPYSII